MKTIIGTWLLVWWVVAAHAQPTSDHSFPLIGKVKPRDANEIASSNWLMGCECLDRDYADYDQLVEHAGRAGRVGTECLPLQRNS